MNTFSINQRHISARMFAGITILAFLLSAFPVAFFVADAQAPVMVNVCKANQSPGGFVAGVTSVNENAVNKGIADSGVNGDIVENGQNWGFFYANGFTGQEIFEADCKVETPPITGSISGTKYNDVGKDYDYGGDPEIPGWTIRLYEVDTPWELYATEVTDVNGEYEFNDIPEGEYKVCEVMQDDWIQTFVSNGSDNESPNVSEEGPDCRTVNIDKAEETNTVNFANHYEAPILTGKLKIVKEVLGGDKSPSDWTMSATASGNEFDFQDSGDSVTFHTVASGLVYAMSELGANGYTLTDIDCEGSTEAQEGGLGWNDIIVGEGDEVTCTFTNTYDEYTPIYGCMDSEATNYNPEATESGDVLCEYPGVKTSTIDGYKWNDEDGDGEWGDDEDGIDDWGIVLRPMTMEPVEELYVSSETDTTVTSVNALASGRTYVVEVSGTYSFGNRDDFEADAEWSRRNDTYTDNPLAAHGWTVGEDTYPSIVGLDLQIDEENINWGSFNEDHLYKIVVEGEDSTLDFSIYDSNYGDNTGGLDVAIYDVTDYITQTDEDGYYSFEVVEGDYQIIEIMQEDWVQTYPANPSYYHVTAPDDGGFDFGNMFVGIIEDPKDTLEACEIEGHKYDATGNPLKDWFIGFKKFATFGDAVEEYTIMSDNTDENGYYCLEWEDADFSEVTDGYDSYIYRIFEKMQSGWEFLSIEEGADYENLTVVADEDTWYGDAEVGVQFGEVNGIIPNNAAYHVDFYNYDTTASSTDNGTTTDDGVSGGGGGSSTSNSGGLSGGSSTRVGSRSSGNPQVAGISDTVDPTPLVLGDQVSAVPLGAANTGAGGTATNVAWVTTLLLLLAGVVATARRFNVQPQGYNLF